MEALLFQAHSGVRYLVLLAGIAALIAALLAASRDGRGADGTLTRIFVGVLDLQAALGIILLIVWAFYGQLIGHIIMMIAAVTIAHIGSARAGKQTVPAAASRMRAITIGVTLLVIVAGILSIGRPIFGSGAAS
jgi:hypothetical protein